jgi:hypothetical protein
MFPQPFSGSASCPRKSVRFAGIVRERLRGLQRFPGRERRDREDSRNLRRLNIQTSSVRFEPGFSFRVIRHHLVDFIPKSVRVIALMDMGEFMDHDVINDLGRGHHALPVERQLSSR